MGSFFCLVPVAYGVNLSVFRQFNNFKIFFFLKNNVYNIRLNPKIIFACKFFSLLFFTYFAKLNIFSEAVLIQLLVSGLMKYWNLGCNLTGIGYRLLKVRKYSLIIKLGYSHLLKFYINKDIKLFKSEKKNKIFFFSSDRFYLSKLISCLKLIKIPDNYKAKGFRLIGEVICVKKQEKFGVF